MDNRLDEIEKRLKLLEEQIEKLNSQYNFELSSNNSTEEDCTVGGLLINFECDNSDCSECQKNKWK